METINNQMLSGILSTNLLCIIHQFLRELNFLATCHEFEREYALYFDMSYFQELINLGAWDELERYLGGFTTLQSNDFSKKLFFEVRKQKYLEALKRGECEPANGILKADLSVILDVHGPVFTQLFSLQHLDNFRFHPHLRDWVDEPTSRNILVAQLPEFVRANPDLNDKLVLPQAGDSRLVVLARQSLEAQFVRCQCPRDLWSLLDDHQCLQQSSASPLVDPTLQQHLHPSSFRAARTDSELVLSEFAVLARLCSGGTGPLRASTEPAPHCASAGRMQVRTSASRPHPDAITEIVTTPAIRLKHASVRKKPARTSVSRPSPEATAGVVSPLSFRSERASAGATPRRTSAAKTSVSRLPEATTGVGSPPSISLERFLAKTTPRRTSAARTLVSRSRPQAITGDIPKTLPLKRPSFGASLDSCSLHAANPQTSPIPHAQASDVGASSARDDGARRRTRARQEENVDTPAEARSSKCPGGDSMLELPGPLVRTLNQGSKTRSMDFHPVQQTLLLVGTMTGELTLWAVKDPRTLVSREFSIWNQRRGMEKLMADLKQDKNLSVNQVRWNQDGSLAGVAYSRGLVQLFKFDGGDRLGPHLQIVAHLSNVNDISFTILDGRIVFVTGGDDKLVKVWDASSGDLLKSFEGHEASVLCVLPSQRGDQNYLLTTSLDGKLKVWSFNGDTAISEHSIGLFASVQYSTDGARLFSCAVGRGGECIVAQLDESNYRIRKTFLGLTEKVDGQVHFHTAQNRILAVGHNSKINYWDMKKCKMLRSVDALGGLETNVVIRFNKDGSLLAATTMDNRIKILVGGVQGIFVLNDLNIRTDSQVGQTSPASTSTQVGLKSQSGSHTHDI